MRSILNVNELNVEINKRKDIEINRRKHSYEIISYLILRFKG